jgi:hypothetical protein
MTTNAWRPADLEAIRTALAIPVSPASIRAINDAMAALERSYPDAIPGAQAHLDAIALLDQAALAAASGEPPATPEPRIRKVTRKGAAGPVPEQLPQRKLDVVEYATELLLEETDTEWSAAGPSAAVVLTRQRNVHIEQLVLLLPRLANWRLTGPDPFQGRLVRG